VKYFALIGGALIALALNACGGSSSANEKQSEPRVVEVAGPHSTLKIGIPPGPPPEGLVVRDLREGTGREVAGAGDTVVVNYAGVNYRTGKAFFDTWTETAPSRFYLKAMKSGWERGLKGMRVGGRRELIVPSRLAYDSGAVVYLIDLLEAKRATP
jgi:peptidylprolyl isomerase